jgi:hypothetical protein
MVQVINVERWAPKVLSDFHRTVKPTPPVLGDWSPHRVARDEMANIILRDKDGIQLTKATWGRSGQEHRCYLDAHDPSKVTRALLPATSIDLIIPHPTGRAWLTETWRVSLRGSDWMMVGCSCQRNPFTYELEFAVLTNSAGSDLKDLVACEPVLVPPVRWASWLTGNTTESLCFPLRPGSLDRRMIRL